MKHISLLLIVTLTMLGAVVTVTQGQQTRSRSSSEVIASEFSAEVTGTVKNVNQKSGKLVLDTADGPVNVVFPAEAVSGIKSGDRVTVSVALIKPAPAASPQTPPRTK